MTVRDAWALGVQRLSDVPDGALDAEYLLSEVLSLPRLQMHMEKQRVLTDAEQAAYFSLLSRRAQREPLQYILGTQVFMGFSIKTDQRALIPRFDTECMVEAALSLARGTQKVLDLCTGTGAIGLAIKKLRPTLQVTATDISEAALSLARENAEALAAFVTFAQGDLFAAVPGQRFSLIVSNPPYIPLSERERLQEEVRREPETALFAGEDGLSFYRRIAREAPSYLEAEGWLLLEIGDTQFEDVAALLAEDFEKISLIRDLGGRPRGVQAKRR